jgi:E3 ubiquitin-protein ligase SHPRH
VGKSLNVKIYEGTQNGFIQPRDLAKFDIVITTYEVLGDELKHVFAFENTRVLRQPKRFTNIPSPLINVEWWRICLDEAQMVHSTNTLCAEMAERLPSVNRWCITGTPIGRSLADLHGLFSFIRSDPYCDRRWFDCLLYEPFKGGDRLPMARATSDVLWRTAKRFVENEIEIPAQTERVFWLDFSSFESHLYQRVIESFRQHRKNCFESLAARNNETNELALSVLNRDVEMSSDEAARVDQFFWQFVDSNAKIDEIDRKTLDKVCN